MSLIQKYLAVNPRRLNPFNRPHHDFEPSGDAAADADYLALVAAGELARYYVTLAEQHQRAGHYRVIAVDGYNNNVLLSQPVPVRRTPADHVDEPLLAAVAAAVAAAAAHDLPFQPELARVFSRRGHEHATLLQRYADGADGGVERLPRNGGWDRAEVARG
jgi:hypothetical protein